jgi:hypothetical protein
MTIIRLDVSVFIDAGGHDPEEVAQAFDRGATSALGGFPQGEVIQVDVDNAAELTAAEIADHGFDLG